GGLEHPLNVPRAWRAGRCIRSDGRPCPTAQHCRQARIKRLLDLLRADVMDMHVDTAGSDNLAFPGDHFGSGSYNYGDAWLYVGITSFPYGSDSAVFYGDICLHDSPVIENHCVGDDRIHRAVAARALRLTHAVANDLPPSELHLLA